MQAVGANLPGANNHAAATQPAAIVAALAPLLAQLQQQQQQQQMAAMLGHFQQQAPSNPPAAATLAPVLAQLQQSQQQATQALLAQIQHGQQQQQRAALAHAAAQAARGSNVRPAAAQPQQQQAVHISKHTKYPQLHGIDGITLARFRELYADAERKARTQAQEDNIAFRATSVITCIPYDTQIAICALGLKAPHRGMDVQDVPVPEIEDFAVGRGVYAATVPITKELKKELKALRMGLSGLPVKRVSDFVVARKKLLKRHGVHLPDKVLIKKYLLPGVSPTELRTELEDQMELGAAQAAKCNLDAFDTLLLQEAKALHKWAGRKRDATSTGRGDSDRRRQDGGSGGRRSLHPRSNRRGPNDSRPSTDTNRRGGRPAQREPRNGARRTPARTPGAASTGNSRGEALYLALSTAERARLHKQKLGPIGGCFGCGAHHSYTKCPELTPAEKRRDPREWIALLKHARAMPDKSSRPRPSPSSTRRLASGVKNAEDTPPSNSQSESKDAGHTGCGRTNGHVTINGSVKVPFMFDDGCDYTTLSSAIVDRITRENPRCIMVQPIEDLGRANHCVEQADGTTKPITHGAKLDLTFDGPAGLPVVLRGCT